MNRDKAPIFVLMDLDDTILDFHRAEAVAIAKTFRQLGAEPTEALIRRYSEINQKQWERLELGEISRRQVLTGRFELLFDELGMSLDGNEAQELYEGLLAIGHWFMPGAEELLEELYGKYKLYIVSNGTAAVQDGRLKSSGIGRYFEDIFISELIGCNKPAKEFFELCTAQIPGFDKERAIIIGDSLSSDILGAVNCGVDSCFFTPGGKMPSGDIRPTYVATDFSQILNILTK